MDKNVQYVCPYCNKSFKIETWFLKHHCKEMKREEEFKSPAGQAAWGYYKYWMKQKYKNLPSDPNTFKKSKFFSNFYKFTEFSQQSNLPDVKLYIKLMLAHKIDPVNWSKDGAYRKYLDYVTYKLSPHDLIKITIKTLLDVAAKTNEDVSNIFEILTPAEVIQLLYQRKLSPWLLIHSKKFTEFYKTKASTEQQINIQALVNPETWAKKFKKSPQDVKIVKKYINELGL